MRMQKRSPTDTPTGLLGEDGIYETRPHMIADAATKYYAALNDPADKDDNFEA